MANPTNANPSHVVTGEALLSYVNILRPAKKRNPNESEKYKVTVLIPKTDLATMARINAAIEATKQAGATEKWGGLPNYVPSPVYDGDGVRPKDKSEFGPECKGRWVLTANSTRKPEVVDANRNPIMNESEIYSGISGRVSMTFFAYNKDGNKGVGCSLDNVQKLRDGVPLAGGSTAEDDFGDGGYAAPAAYAPQAPATYAQPGYAPQAPAAYAPAPQPGYPAYYGAPVQAPQTAYPQQPAYAPQPAAQGMPQINPITGLPF
ncbi:MAG TPA: DUF2815 family protein [Candidatus Limiplasma sp.]|nr:DUF2815 family protein [Candidatus Limiplasma sp.]